MLIFGYSSELQKLVLVSAVLCAAVASSGCQSGASAAAQGGGNVSASTPTSVIPPTSSSGATGVASTKIISTINAIQVIPKADPTGSFDAVAVPLAGGTSVKATRLYNLDGSIIATGAIPTWFVEARAFLTSTRTSPGAPAPTSSASPDTPCAYFDNVVDINPDNAGFYTIDGYNTDNNSADIDQCAGTNASELSQLGMSIRVDRRFMNPTDKLQVIVKAKPIDAPNTSIVPSSCVSAGFFDPTSCANQLFTISMRTAPTAAAKPFYILFPSAKAFDLLSETVLMPINIDQSLTTITLDRVKGGAVIYGLTVIRLE